MLIALVVEDEAALQILYGRVLVKVGFNVIYANDGNEAIEVLKELEPQLLLLDIRMPNLNGIGVIDYIRNAGLENMHIVVATATKEYERYVHVLPSAQFLLKPVLPPQLIEIADEVRSIYERQITSS